MASTVGILREIKQDEDRIAIAPSGVHFLVEEGHRVLIEKNEGAEYLERAFGGRGVLISGVPGVEPAKVVILGGGVVGLNAAQIAAGVGAQVTIFDVNSDRLRYLHDVLPPNVTTLYSNPLMIR